MLSPNISVADVWSEIGVTSDGRVKLQSSYDGRYRYERLGTTYHNGSSVVVAGDSLKTSEEVAAKVRSASTGAVSRNAVKATVTRDIAKTTVLKKVFGNARLGPLGTALNAYLLVQTVAELAGYYEKDNWLYRRRDGRNYLVFKVKDANSPPSYYTYSKFQTWCNEPPTANYFAPKVSTRQCTDVQVYDHYPTFEEFLSFCPQGATTFNAHGVCVQGITLMDWAVHTLPLNEDIPLTESEYIHIADPDISDKPDEYVKAADIRPSEWSQPSVMVLDGQIAQSSPYTDPKDGKAYQTRWDFGPNGSVKESTIPRPDLAPNSAEAPLLKPQTDIKPDTDGATETEAEPQKQPTDTDGLCDKYPDIAACDKQPEAPETDPIKIPVETHDLLFAPDNVFPATGVCPAPITFDVSVPYVMSSRQFSYDTAPMCETASRLRGVVIALAWLAAATFCLRAFKGG